jgi:AcrR family transcriptional regulator
MAQGTSTPAARTAPRRNTTFAKRPRRGPGSYDRRLSPTERRDEQRRTLVDAAAHVFARDGYANASVAAILEASGLSRGTFYRHFRDLREAFLAVQEHGSDVLYERVSAAYGSETNPPDKMRRSIVAYLQICMENGDLSRVFHREAVLAGSEYAAIRRRGLDRLHEFLREGSALALREGLIRRMPDDLTLFAVIVAIEGVALRYLEDHREHEILEAVEPLVRLAGRALF